MTTTTSPSPARGTGAGSNPIERLVRHVDRWQQRHRVPAFLFGVVKKYGDDRGGALAAQITYYGFLALFPLLLTIVTVLGFLFGNNSGIQRRVLNSALADFPIIGKQLGSSIHPLNGSGVGLAVGIAGLIWGSLGVTQVSQYAMAQVWNVPGVVRPNFVVRMTRGFILLGVLGTGVLGTMVLASMSTFGDLGAGVKISTAVLSLALNVAIYIGAFRVMTPRQIPSRPLLPGAVIGGVAWTGLQALGGYIVGHQLRHASEVYGFFGSVLGLVSWLYLASQITLYAAELNVVSARRLWPRSIVQPPLTDADERTLADIAGQEERRPEQTVEVTFDRPAAPVDGT